MKYQEVEKMAEVLKHANMNINVVFTNDTEVNELKKDIQELFSDRQGGKADLTSDHKPDLPYNSKLLYGIYTSGVEIYFLELGQ